jgi:hypothetical protein
MREGLSMSAIIEAPRDLLEEVAALRLPPKTDQLLQSLMDRNNEGALTSEERDELEGLVALSETMALLRVKALHLLGRKPL